MQVIIGFFIILAHLVAGNLISTLIGGFIPGSVIGMVLMFISLLTGIVKDYQIRTVSTFLTDNMTMFFIPAFMGIMDLWGIIRMNIVAWVAVVVATTLMVLLSTAFTQDGIECLMSKIKGKKSHKSRNREGFAFECRVKASTSKWEESFAKCSSQD